MLRNTVKQFAKTLLNRVFLPCVYAIWRRSPVRKGKILFADSNSDSMPESMAVVYNALKRGGATPRCCFSDFRRRSIFQIISYLVSFMKEYATAEYVFICNYFLPVTSCKKRNETTVVQLWHSCGLLKKFAYDTEEDISPLYHGDVTKNISLVTVSSPACVPVWQKALRLDPLRQSIIQSTGVSRTDVLHDPAWQASCKHRFAALCPALLGKKIVLYAPTFRGSASQPRLEGYEAILALEEKLGPNWAVVKKLHPHLAGSDPIPMSSTELFPCADVLITDYSSLLFEYILLDKPFVIFAPDYDEYRRTRGFYEDPALFPGEFVTEADDLPDAVRRSFGKEADDDYRAFKEHHSGSCDGHATERILSSVGLTRD